MQKAQDIRAEDQDLRAEAQLKARISELKLRSSELKLRTSELQPFWHLLALLGPPGGPLGSKCLPGPSLDLPRSLQESLLESPGADLGSNLSQLGANLGPT